MDVLKQWVLRRGVGGLGICIQVGNSTHIRHDIKSADYRKGNQQRGIIGDHNIDPRFSLLLILHNVIDVILILIVIVHIIGIVHITNAVISTLLFIFVLLINFILVIFVFIFIAFDLFIIVLLTFLILVQP